MIKITKKQGQHLAFIHHYTKVTGVPPAETDMQTYFRTTPAAVHYMVMKLAEKGLISKTPNTPRSITVLVPHDQIPELGEDAARKVNLMGRNWSQASYIKACRFAAEAHQGQLFPGTNLPYIMHISLVSMEVMACLAIEKGHDGDLAVQCALLHDVIEDTNTAYSDVGKAFGNKVAKGVLALTNDKSLSKEHRMGDSLERIKQQPYEVWLVKLADRITNLAPPPHYWDRDKIQRYREEAIEIQRALKAASEYLGQRLADKIDEYGMYL